MKRSFLVILCLGFLVSVQAQTPSTEYNTSKTIHRKGRLFFYFGWNWSNYSTSDITFKGDGYNFTLKDVRANDRPTAFDPKVYFNPAKLSIPQYQYRIGYYITDKYAFSWGFNHMKYVMDAYQTVKITGTINTPEGGEYNGTYTNEDIELNKDFLQFEHTNGLNYLDFNFDRTETLWVSKNRKTNLSAILGIGAGIMYPKSDIKLFNKGVDRWHLAGFGVSSQVALRFDFLKNMFVQAQLDGGYINMPDILTTGELHARAKQKFLFIEKTVMIGGYKTISRK
jgi:hypothetical protein